MLIVNLFSSTVHIVHCKRNNVTTCVSLLNRVVSNCVSLCKPGLLPHVCLPIQFGPLPSVSRCIRGQSVEACTWGDSPGQLPSLPASNHPARCHRVCCSIARRPPEWGEPDGRFTAWQSDWAVSLPVYGELQRRVGAGYSETDSQWI